MTRLWAISKTTFIQTIRQPIYGILILVTFLVLVISLSFTGWTMGSDYHVSNQKMLENMGLSTLLVGGLLVAAFSASSVLSREIEDRTALTVISKPVQRATFVLGKFVGVSGAVAVAFYLCSLGFLMTVRHRVVVAEFDPYDWPVIVLGLTALGAAIGIALWGNYFFGWPIISASVWGCVVLMSLGMAVLSFVGKEWQIVPLGYDTPKDQAIHSQLLVGIAVIFMAVTIFVAVAVAASTRLGQVMTLGVCCSVFLVGSMHPYLFGYWAEKIAAAKVLGWIVPKLTYFFPLDALNKDDVSIPGRYVATAAAYCALYVSGVLGLGIALFERRELEATGATASIPAAVALLAWTGRALAITAGIAALVLVSLPAFHNLTGAMWIGGLAVAAALSWMLFSSFGSGASWAYWCVSVIAFLGFAGQIAAVIYASALQIDQIGAEHVIIVAGAILAGLVLLILLLPKTRRHFKSSA
ncbi:MAG: ABC transporter permease [Planctomycetota bacterium]